MLVVGSPARRSDTTRIPSFFWLLNVAPPSVLTNRTAVGPEEQRLRLRHERGGVEVGVDVGQAELAPANFEITRQVWPPSVDFAELSWPPM
jgi:hypothetical protein